MIDESKREQIAKRVLEITRDWSGINNINEDTRFADVMSDLVKHKVEAFWKAIKNDFGIEQHEFKDYVFAMAKMKKIKHFVTVGNLINLIMEEATLKGDEELTREEVSAEVLEVLCDELNIEGLCESDELINLPYDKTNSDSWINVWETLRARFRVVFMLKMIGDFRFIGCIVTHVMENGDLSRNSDEKCEVEERDIVLKGVECRGRNGWFQFCEVNMSVIEPDVRVHFWSKRRGDNPPIAINGPVDQVLKIFEGIIADIKSQMKGGNK